MAQLRGCDYCGKVIEANTEYVSFPIYKMVPVDSSSNYPAGTMAAQGVNVGYQAQQIDQRDYHDSCWLEYDSPVAVTPTVQPTTPEEAPTAAIEEVATTPRPPEAMKHSDSYLPDVEPPEGTPPPDSSSEVSKKDDE